MITLNKDKLVSNSNPNEIPNGKIRDYGNLAEALYHAEVGEVVWFTEAKSNKRTRIERTETGWIYQVLN